MFDINIISNMSYIQLSINFINSVLGLSKSGIECEKYVEALKYADTDDLESELSSEIRPQVFWLNIYNANIQFLLCQRPEIYTDRNTFFSTKRISIAGDIISLDLIEHGILRRSKFKCSLGYLNKFFPIAFERKFRLNKIDYHIHFALNCGAKSCPMIVTYNPENFNE